jgi:acetyl esterase/lipase
MFHYDSSCPVLNSTLRPDGLPPDTPEISALFQDVARLPPQLILYSKDEILASDSARWIKKSRLSGVDVTEYAVNGEMHTFAVGWPVCGWKMQQECDKMMLNYIFSHVGKT